MTNATRNTANSLGAMNFAEENLDELLQMARSMTFTEKEVNMDYIFFASQGNIDDETQKNLIDTLRATTSEEKMLGIFTLGNKIPAQVLIDKVHDCLKFTESYGFKDSVGKTGDKIPYLFVKSFLTQFISAYPSSLADFYSIEEATPFRKVLFSPEFSSIPACHELIQHWVSDVQDPWFYKTGYFSLRVIEDADVITQAYMRIKTRWEANEGNFDKASFCSLMEQLSLHPSLEPKFIREIYDNMFAILKNHEKTSPKPKLGEDELADSFEYVVANISRRDDLDPSIAAQLVFHQKAQVRLNLLDHSIKKQWQENPAMQEMLASMLYDSDYRVQSLANHISTSAQE